MKVLLNVLLRVLFTVLTSTAWATNHYVDPSVSSSGNGLSWATAWKTLANITGLQAGDTVYLSGGTYSLSAPWAPSGGTSGSPITYAAGQDVGHSGTVIFDGGNTAGRWLSPNSWSTFNGGYQGARHFLLQNFKNSSEYVVSVAKTGVRVLYVTMQKGDAFNLGSSDRYEIAFCTMESTFDHAISANGPAPGTAYDQNLIHDNIILLDQKSDGSGWGSDGIQNGAGISLFNNIIQGVKVASYPSGQHQDGIQTDGRFTKIYNNTFIDIGNYAVFFELFGSANDMQVFNNLIYMSDTRYAGGGQQAIAIGRSGGASGSITFNNVKVVNNTIANYGGVAVAMSPGPQSTWNSTDVLMNNAAYNTAGYSVDGNVSGQNSATNKNTKTGGSTIFASYQPPTGSSFAYDLHLRTTDTILKGQGANETSLGINGLTLDHDGKARPSSGAWDIGAFQAGGTTPPPPLGLIIGGLGNLVH